VKRALVLIPRRVLVNQWVDRAQEMSYGLGLIKNPTLSKEEIEKNKRMGKTLKVCAR
jgi:hypothetical protein